MFFTLQNMSYIYVIIKMFYDFINIITLIYYPYF